MIGLVFLLADWGVMPLGVFGPVIRGEQALKDAVRTLVSKHAAWPSIRRTYELSADVLRSHS